MFLSLLEVVVQPLSFLRKDYLPHSLRKICIVSSNSRIHIYCSFEV